MGVLLDENGGVLLDEDGGSLVDEAGTFVGSPAVSVGVSAAATVIVGMSGATTSYTRDVDIVDVGDVNRIAAVFVDAAGALETPTAVTVTVRAPGYPSVADVAVNEDDANVTLGVSTWPLPLRRELAGRLRAAGYSFVAADLVAGTGCVEYLHEPTTPGNWRYVIAATAPSKGAERFTTRVRRPLE